MKQWFLGLCVMLFFSLPLAAASTEVLFVAPAGEKERLVIKSSTDIEVFAPVIHAFQQIWPNIAISYGELTTNVLSNHVAAACANKQFTADLVISSSPDQQVKLVNDGCAQRPDGELLNTLPGWAQWRNEVFGFTFEPAVTVYNKEYFMDRIVPQDRFALVDLLREGDDFYERIGTYDIETSGVGYLFAFQDALQATTWGRLVESFGRNKARVFCCTSEILERVADGTLLLGYNVLGSYALAFTAENPGVGIVLPTDYTLVMTRAGLISRHARQPELASMFLRFLYSEPGRAVLSEKAYLFSPIGGSEMLASIGNLGASPSEGLRPIALSPALLVGLDSAKRRYFLQQWRAAMPDEQRLPPR